MDRDSLRGLRAQPGYLKFLSAATLARVSDEMFSVGVVLLVLDRTDSPALAGATVAAITLPSLISGPLLFDRLHRRLQSPAVNVEIPAGRCEIGVPRVSCSRS